MLCDDKFMEEIELGNKYFNEDNFTLIQYYTSLCLLLRLLKTDLVSHICFKPSVFYRLCYRKLNIPIILVMTVLYFKDGGYIWLFLLYILLYIVCSIVLFNFVEKRIAELHLSSVRDTDTFLELLQNNTLRLDISRGEDRIYYREYVKYITDSYEQYMEDCREYVEQSKSFVETEDCRRVVEKLNNIDGILKENNNELYKYVEELLGKVNNNNVKYIDNRLFNIFEEYCKLLGTDSDIEILSIKLENKLIEIIESIRFRDEISAKASIVALDKTIDKVGVL